MRCRHKFYSIGFPVGADRWTLIASGRNFKKVRRRTEHWARAAGGKGHVSFLHTHLSEDQVGELIVGLNKPIYGVPYHPNLPSDWRTEYDGEVIGDDGEPGSGTLH